MAYKAEQAYLFVTENYLNELKQSIDHPSPTLAKVLEKVAGKPIFKGFDPKVKAQIEIIPGVHYPGSDAQTFCIRKYFKGFGKEYSGKNCVTSELFEDIDFSTARSINIKLLKLMEAYSQNKKQ